MQINREIIDGMLERLTLTIELTDYQEEVVKELKKIRQKIEVPGFRRGNAPLPLIEKQYKEAITVDVIDKIISQSLENYIKENDIALLTDIESQKEDFENINLSQNDAFVFHFNLAVIPDLNIDITEQDKAVFYNIHVTEKDIEQKIEHYKSLYGTDKDVECIGETDYVGVDFTEATTSPSNDTEALKVENAHFLMDFVKNTEIKNTLLGKKVGESLTFSLKEAFEEDVEVASLLNLKKDDKRIYNNYTCTIKSIKRHLPAEIDEKFFEHFDKDVTNIDDLKKRIKTISETQNTYFATQKFIFDIKKILLEKYKDLKLPEEFLCKHLSSKIKNEDLQQQKKNFMEEYLLMIIDSNITKKYHLEIGEKEMKNTYLDETRMTLTQYGIDITNAEKYLQDFSIDTLSKESFDTLLYKTKWCKIADIFKEKATISNEDISLEDFLKK